MRIKVTAKTKTRTKTIVSLSMFLVLVSFFCDKVASSSSSSDDDDEDIWDNERFKLTSKNIEAADAAQVRLNFHGLTEEEQGSLQVPLLMRCDACRAISFVLTKDLRKFERIRGRGRALGKRLQANQYEQSFEETCKNEEYWGAYYGITHGADGLNYLNGPGLTALPPDLHKGQTLSLETTRKGGFWSFRLREACQQHVYGGDHDEEEMYDLYYEFSPTTTTTDNSVKEKNAVVGEDSKKLAEMLCKQTCKKYPSKRPKEGWALFDEKAFQKKLEDDRKTYEGQIYAEEKLKELVGDEMHESVNKEMREEKEEKERLESLKEAELRANRDDEL